MADLTSLLLATQDPNTRAQAEAQIRDAEQKSADQYFTLLAQELANNDKPKIPRILAGLLLKNGLSAKDPSRRDELKRRWAGLPSNCRDLVKQATTSALIAADLEIGKSAAQVLAKIGSIEIPEGAWPGLVPLLLQHVTNQDPSARKISLVCLGYLCEDLVSLQEEREDPASVAGGMADQILTAVAQGMRDPDNTIKLEATRAFYHAVVLAQKNFQMQKDRDFIMQVVTETCSCKESEAVQIAAFECLVQIATEYYEHLLPYMTVVGPLTWDTIRSAPEKVAIPAMEFWSTVCDEELYLAELMTSEQPCEKRSLNIISQALPYLIPLLTETLPKQQDGEDDGDTWNLAMAAGTCLGLVAQVVGDQCVELVIQFVSQNFENPNWKFREAAVLAYGSIMEGPTSEKMQPLLAASYGKLVATMQDSNVAVRDTLAWTLGRIAQFHPTIVPVADLTPVLGNALSDVPRVSSNVCWCIQVLAESQPGVPGQAPETTALSQFFPALAQALLQVVPRKDASEKNLRMAAYNALSSLVSRSGNDCMVYMEKLVEEMLNHLTESFKAMDKECDLQGYICGVLTALTQRLRQKIVPVSDRLMEEALKVITAYQQVKGGAQVLQEEALLLIAAIANAVGAHFERYMTHFAPHLKVGLENYEDVQVCLMSTGIIGDLCRCLEGKMALYCDTLLTILYTNLTNEKVDRRIKACIMTSFGDIALAITGEFEKYLNPVITMLQEASKTRVQDQDVNEDWIEYLNSLREGVLEAYTGIIHGLKEANKLNLLKGHVNELINFIRDICNDKFRSESVMKAALGVMGDLIFVFQQELVVHLKTPNFAPCIEQMVAFAARSNDPSTQRTGAWLQSLLQKYG